MRASRATPQSWVDAPLIPRPSKKRRLLSPTAEAEIHPMSTHAATLPDRSVLPLTAVTNHTNNPTATPSSTSFP